MIYFLCGIIYLLIGFLFAIIAKFASCFGRETLNRSSFICIVLFFPLVFLYRLLQILCGDA